MYHSQASQHFQVFSFTIFLMFGSDPVSANKCLDVELCTLIYVEMLINDTDTFDTDILMILILILILFGQIYTKLAI